ncbi:histone H3 methyltransferase complex and RNA cleavage factor II complex, subunit SWD2 [Piedraia hortae CBS 480.64]|uniref:Histone H3 methyltransferase complex and RNA cleavage factor II complex, subunit SWD2 n=1 Tax=Piedraia hortae CBS 480.64 TaxID=1314780 RepID=A0A6A7BXL0_9PEZI|nr:histone H3 methyltransferase complex and RNA cleavage factor II complex, subunit SWD2 [Piedraia hortae CBS 480.64]
MPPTCKISDIVATFRPAKAFSPPSPSNTHISMDFDDTGEFLLLSRTDDTLQLYNTAAGAHAKELKSHKYGCALARFTHHAPSIIYASTKVDDGIRYLSMHDNSFIRYFRGHEDRVTCLAVNPSKDQFLSAARDNTVRIWDARSTTAIGLMAFDGLRLCAYDPSACVIAVAAPAAQLVVLYDLKNFDKPPFATFDLREIEKKCGNGNGGAWTGMEFANNGQTILVTTNGAGHYLIDAFNGDLRRYLRRPSGPNGLAAPVDPLPKELPSYCQADAALAPDGRFVIGGNGKKPGLLVWDTNAPAQDAVGGLLPTSELPCTTTAKVAVYNPRYNLLASADRDVMLWQPDADV